MARVLAALACLTIVAPATATEPERSRTPVEPPAPGATRMEIAPPGGPGRAEPGPGVARGPQRSDRVEAGRLEGILESGRRGPGPGGTRRATAAPAASGVYCAGGQSRPCWCEGASDCSRLITACVGAGHQIDCAEHDAEGKPTGCTCG